MRHLDLQILFSASYREKAENKTTLRIADLEPDTQDRREVRKILTVQLNHQSKAAGRNAASGGDGERALHRQAISARS